MNIVHVLPKGVVGGAEKLALNIAIRQSALGHTVSMWFLFDGGSIESEAVQKGLKTHDFGLKNAFNIKGLSFIFKARATNPDILHIHTLNIALIYAAFIRRRCGIVLHQHELSLKQKSLPVRTLVRLFKRVADQYIGVSRDTCRHMVEGLRIRGRRINLVQNGIDLDHFGCLPDKETIRKELGVTQAATVVGAVGRLVEQKGFDMFLAVAKNIKHSIPDSTFIVVGDGPCRHELEREAARLGLASCVRFLGMRNDVPRLLKAMDLLLVTSRWEPFGIVVLEAMAAEVPIVAFRVGGIPEILGDQCGELVQPNDVLEMSEAALKFLKNDHRRKEYVAIARELVKKFSVNAAVEQLNNIYASAILKNDHKDDGQASNSN
jgi:glycosyltransferase involved in cell wall biosynthesis